MCDALVEKAPLKESRSLVLIDRLGFVMMTIRTPNATAYNGNKYLFII